MKDCYEFRFFTDITVTREDVVDDLIDGGFFDKEVTLTDEDGEEYTDIITDEEAAESYEPDFKDYEKLAQKWFEEENCEYYGPDVIN